MGNMNRKRILCVVGTRREAIKMAPVILSLQKQPWAAVKVLITAQHRQLLDQVLSIFDIVPDYDLNIMQSDQQLTDLTARLLLALDKKQGSPIKGLVKRKNTPSFKKIYFLIDS